MLQVHTRIWTIYVYFNKGKQRKCLFTNHVLGRMFSTKLCVSLNTCVCIYIFKWGVECIPSRYLLFLWNTECGEVRAELPLARAEHIWKTDFPRPSCSCSLTSLFRKEEEWGCSHSLSAKVLTGKIGGAQHVRWSLSQLLLRMKW